MTDKRGLERTPMRLMASRLAVACAIVMAVSVVGCSQPLEPPAKVVQSVLELRAKNSDDAAAYAPYFEGSSVATALAAAAAETTRTPPIPAWKPPVVDSSTDATAIVTVTWKPDTRFRGWPPTTTFALTKLSGRWVIVDATENTSTPRSTTASSTQP